MKLPTYREAINKIWDWAGQDLDRSKDMILLDIRMLCKNVIDELDKEESHESQN